MSTVEEDDFLLSGTAVLFIAHDFKGLALSVGYLERRKVRVFHSSNLKEAIEILGQRKINFVFLSVNLPNATPAKVISVLAHSFKMKTVAFAERSEIGSRVILNSVHHDHKIHAPLNGPKAANKILQILKNESGIDREPTEERISVKSGSSLGDDPNAGIIIQKGHRGALHREPEGGPAPLPEATKADQINFKKPSSLPGPVKSADILAKKSSLSSLNGKLDINPHLIPLRSEGDNLGAVKKICALAIQSQNFNGYLIMGMKEGATVPLNLVQRIRETLIRYLGKKGEIVAPGSVAFEMDFHSVDFSNWAQDFADYIAVGEGQEDGIAMAFISGEDALPFLTVSVAPHMRAIARKDIKPNTILDFDVYLHFPDNQRFVRYGVRGGYLTTGQLNRLKKAGVVYMHIPEEQQRLFKAYCGKHFLRARLLDSKDIIQLSKAFKTVAI